MEGGLTRRRISSARTRKRHANHVILVRTTAIDAVVEALGAFPRLDPFIGYVGAAGGTAGPDAVLARQFTVTSDFSFGVGQ